ncbi:MAG: peptide deformylase [Proteobacteria bacterium]|nr:peptide deformylase [Pseudomonadota bacterium]
MAVLPIRIYPDPVLKETGEPIDRIDEGIRRLAEDMLDTMYEAPGSGLAAPQVGQSCRLIVVDGSGAGDRSKGMVLINPRIVTSEGEILYEEACLSVQDFSAKVRRSTKVLVQALDLDGNPVEIEAEGRLAVVFQHEIDHLDGVLFIDHISRLKRDLYRRRIKKLHKQKQVQDSDA